MKIIDPSKAKNITTATTSFRMRRCLVVSIRFSQIISEGSLAGLILIGLIPGIKIGKFCISKLSEAAEISLNLVARLNPSSFSNVTKAEQGLVNLSRSLSFS